MKKQSIAIFSVLVVLCSFIIYPASASTLTPAGSANATSTFIDGTVVYYVTARVFKPNLIDYDYLAMTDFEYYNGVKEYFEESVSYMYETVINVTVNLRNTGDTLAYANTEYLGLLPEFNYSTYTPYGYYLESVTDGFTVYNLNANGEIRLKPTDQRFAYAGKLAIPKDANYNYTFNIHLYYVGGKGTYTGGSGSGNSGDDGIYFNPNNTTVTITSLTLPYPTSFTSTDITTSVNDLATFYEFNTWFSEIYHKINRDEQSYSDVSSSSNTLETGSSSMDTQTQSNHTTELSYFNQTNQALSNSGIQNYQFSNDQINGIGSVSNDFTFVWNSLGNWNTVYIFSITLSLALVIIRYGKRYKIE